MRTNTKIILITSCFPYYPGEQFLETEVKYWAKKKDVDLTIIPAKRGNKTREIPHNINVNSTLVNNKLTLKRIIVYMFKAFLNRIFWKEIIDNCIDNPKKIKIALISFVHFLHYKKILKKYILAANNKNLIFYTYWYTEITYALQFLKKIFNFKLITRIHGFDLYKERKKYNYMPLRRQFTEYIDEIYTVTDSAIGYLSETYGFSENIISTSRLGVNDHYIKNSFNQNNIFHVVSCSFLVKVKRIGKIIDSLAKLADLNQNVNIRWTHIGDGLLKNELLQKAENSFSDKSNFEYTFLGEIENKDIYEFYRNNDIDVFINTSESEGVPLSIMEALSCSIPVIAPDIGGISDMIINNYNGVLMSADPKIEEIVRCLNNIEILKNQQVRNNAYNIYKNKYDACVNYKNFIEKII